MQHLIADLPFLMAHQQVRLFLVKQRFLLIPDGLRPGRMGVSPL